MSANTQAGGVMAILFAAVLWGTTGTAATFAPEVSPLAIGAVAMGVGGLLQAAIAFKQILHHRAKLKQNWLLLLAGALAVAIYPLAFYASMHFAGVTVGTVISIGTAPLFSALIEYALEGSKLSKRWMWGSALGIAGMLLLCMAKNSGHADSTPSTNVLFGALLGLLAGLTYALYSWTARQIMQQGIDSTTAMGATFGLGGLLLMPVLWVTGGPLVASWNNGAVGIYMALVPMFIGYVSFGYGLAHVPASMATTLTLLEPVVAAVLAVFIVGEKINAQGWLGIALVAVCLLIISKGDNKPLPQVSLPDS